MKANRTTSEVTQKASNCLDSNKNEYQSLQQRKEELISLMNDVMKETAKRFGNFGDGGIILPHNQNPFILEGERIITFRD